MKRVRVRRLPTEIAKPVAAGITLLLAPAAAQAQTVLFNSLPTGSTPQFNVDSQAYEATQTAEFGDELQLTQANQQVGDVTIGLSNWAIASDYLTSGSPQPAFSNIASSLSATGYTVPLTLNIYAVNTSGPTPTVGALLLSDTANILIPWRPENNPSDNSVWIASDGTPYHGLYTTATFDLSSFNLALPQDVIVTLAFNTSDYGANPTGVHDGTVNAAPYDSLNFALGGTATVGSLPNPDTAFQSTGAGISVTPLQQVSGIADSDAVNGNGEPAIEVEAAVTQAPEPSTFALFGAGAAMLALVFRWRRSA